MTNNIELIVGLANPGSEYQATRHNAGSWYVEALARAHHCQLNVENKFFARTGRATIAGHDVRLMIPTTYMNLSGKAVAALANFYRIPAEHILVAFDELDLPPGVAKFKTGGSSSQNGVRDIVSKLANNKNFHRLRIGIGHPGHKQQVTGHVLGKASQLDQQRIDMVIDEAVRCTPLLFEQGLTAAMNRLHSFKADQAHTRT